jgi:hypothetical protein
MSTGRFHIIFDGPALDTHEMNVRDLAPALLAVSDIFDEINRVAFDNRYKIDVKVQTSFQSGSFDATLVLYINNVVDILNSKELIATTVLMQLLDIKGLIPRLVQLFRWVRRRRITKIIEPEGEKVRIEINENFIEIEPHVFALYKSKKLRKAFEVLVANTLAKVGFDSVKLGVLDASYSVSILKEEGPWFNTGELEDEFLGNSSRRVNVEIVSPNFQEGSDWLFSDGSLSFQADIRDDIFLQKIQHGEISFTKGDILSVEMVEDQTRTASGLKTDRFIIEVYGLNPKVGDQNSKSIRRIRT